VTGSNICDWCGNIAVGQIHWKRKGPVLITPCRDARRTAACQYHLANIERKLAANPGCTWRCSPRCPFRHNHAVRRIERYDDHKKTDYRYQRAVERYVASGLLADKEAMVELVTLPADFLESWGSTVWGTIVPAEPRRARRGLNYPVAFFAALVLACSILGLVLTFIR
jgi:hypothetical protein